MGEEDIPRIAVDRAIGETSIPDCADFLRVKRFDVERVIQSNLEEWAVKYPDAPREQLLANAAVVALLEANRWYSWYWAGCPVVSDKRSWWHD